MNKLNVFQAALALRINYEHVDGFSTEAVDDVQVNMYLIMHDSLHTYLGLKPELEDEPMVLAAEQLLGGVNITQKVDLDELTTRLGNINEEAMELLIDFYSQHFAQ